MTADIIDIKTRDKRLPATARHVENTGRTRKQKRKGEKTIPTRKEEHIIEALEELREGGGLGALERLISCLYEWIQARRFVSEISGSQRRGVRSDRLLGHCLDELSASYDDATSPAAVSLLLRRIATQHRRYWQGQKW